jgi:hypothetical protein
MGDRGRRGPDHLPVLASAFFTSVIGVHSIFGAFMVGLMCPHEGEFAIKLIEMIEDLGSTLFVPLFFALSGINTYLALLDSGIVWGYVVAVTVVAFMSKLIGGSLGARFNGMVWCESCIIGALMSCRVLVELIVLNIGLQDKILSTRTFTMFVVMALVTTFATAPLVSWLYPAWYAGQDPIEKAFGTSTANSSTGRDVFVSGQVAVVPEGSFADILATQAVRGNSDPILVPWSETGTLAEMPSFFSFPKTSDLVENRDFATLTGQIFSAAARIAGVGVFIDKSLLADKSGDVAPVAPLSRQLTRDTAGPALLRRTTTLPSSGLLAVVATGSSEFSSQVVKMTFSLLAWVSTGQELASSSRSHRPRGRISR